ncbi:hypothetical protein ABPG77_007298 [Micractinium sp. CCAP 211/92]
MGTTTRKKAEASGEAQAGQPKRAKRQRSTSPTEAQAPAAKSRRRKTHTAETESGHTGKKEEPAGSQSKGAGKARAVPTAAAPKAARGRGGAQAALPSASTAPITINRAPVLTLWVAVVAQRQGFSWEEALTFGKEVSGILAQSKGRSLGIYEAKERSEEEEEARAAEEAEAGVQRVDVFGMRLKAVSQGGQQLAYSGGAAIKPGGVQAYLRRAFKERLGDAKAAMEELAAAVPAEQLGREAYKLYERFRPEWRGWGQAGQLDPQKLHQLAESWQQEA